MLESKKEYQTVILAILLNGVELLSERCQHSEPRIHHSPESRPRIDLIDFDMFQHVADVSLLQELYMLQHLGSERTSEKATEERISYLADVITTAGKLSTLRIDSNTGVERTNKSGPLHSIVEIINQIEKGDFQARYHVAPLGDPAALVSVFLKKFDIYSADDEGR